MAEAANWKFVVAGGRQLGGVSKPAVLESGPHGIFTVRPTADPQRLSALSESLSKYQADAKTGVMRVGVFNNDVVADFEAKSDALFEPVIHAATEINAAGSGRSEEQRISSAGKRHDFARLAGFQKMIARVRRQNAEAFVK